MESNILQQYEEFDPSTRSLGMKALETVLSIPKNVEITEKLIYTMSTNESMYKHIIYQTIGDILAGNKLSYVISLLKTHKIFWEHPIFDEPRAKIAEQNDYIQKPFEVEEGVIECTSFRKDTQQRCGSKRVFSFSKQTRSADEPATTFANCVECGAKWTYSG